MSKRPKFEEKIGEKLIRCKVLEPYHVQNVLIRQQHGDKRLFGEIAVDLGYLPLKTLETHLQRKGPDMFTVKQKKKKQPYHVKRPISKTK